MGTRALTVEKRTKEQKRQSTHGKHARGAGTEGTGAPLRTTDILAGAQELRFARGARCGARGRKNRGTDFNFMR